MSLETDYLETIEHWRARFESVGVPGSAIDDVIDRLADWKDWPHLWRDLGDKECQYAEREEAAGHQVTGTECWFRAGLYYHFGQFILFHDEELRRQLIAAKLSAFGNAYPGMRPKSYKMMIEGKKGTLHGVVRHPTDKEPTPAVIVLPGADSSKEEYAGFEKLLLDRGLSTLSIDGPGQGETRYEGYDWRFDYEEAFPAVIDFIRSTEGFASSSIGLVGFSFGGYLSPRVAAQCPEIGAAVSLGGCYDLSEWDNLQPLLREDLAYLFQAKDLDDARQLATSHVSLEDSLPQISGKLLIVHSTDDRIFSVDNASRMKSLKPDAEVVIYEGGDHCCHNRSHHAKPLIADWLMDELIT